MKLKNLLQNILLLISTTVLLILAAEIILRLSNANAASEWVYDSNAGAYTLYNYLGDDELRYELKPNAQHGDIQTNKFGFRDYDYELTKPASTFRILALGDSTTFGHSVSLNSTYVKILEGLLNKGSKAHNFEAWNLGVSGYNIKQEASTLEKKAQYFNPDLIILSCNPEDLGSSAAVLLEENRVRHVFYVYERVPLLAKISPKLDFYLMKHSFFYRFFNNKIIYLLLKFYSLNPTYYDLWVNENLRALENINKIAKEKNTPLIVVLFPYLDDFDTEKVKHGNDILKDVLQKENIAYLDLLDIYKTYDYNLLRFKPEDKIHPTELGHKIAAETIYGYLLNKTLIK